MVLGTLTPVAPDSIREIAREITYFFDTNSPAILNEAPGRLFYFQSGKRLGEEEVVLSFTCTSPSGTLIEYPTQQLGTGDAVWMDRERLEIRKADGTIAIFVKGSVLI
jgi:hypothetical protein